MTRAFSFDTIGSQQNSGPIAYLIAGMHRSGTSAFARTISLLGAKLPHVVMDPSPDNPKGYWESQAISNFNDDIFAQLGGSWNDVTLFVAPRQEVARKQSFIDRAAAAIATEFEPGHDIVLKEPRICLLADLW